MDKKLRKSEKLEFADDSVTLKGMASSDSSLEASGDKENGDHKGTLVTGDTGDDKDLKAEVAQMLSDLKKGDHQVEENGGGGSFNQWENANLGDDGANEKFRRLMGLGKKGNSPGAPAARKSFMG